MSASRSTIALGLVLALAPALWGAPPPDDGVAAVVTYIRVAWKNTGTPVTPKQVSEMRALQPE